MVGELLERDLYTRAKRKPLLTVLNKQCIGANNSAERYNR